MFKPSAIGQRIKESRGDNTQRWLALEISKRTDSLLTKQTVQNWEAGRNMPTMENFFWICVVTGKCPSFFLETSVCQQATDKHCKDDSSSKRKAV